MTLAFLECVRSGTVALLLLVPPLTHAMSVPPIPDEKELTLVEIKLFLCAMKIQLQGRSDTAYSIKEGEELYPVERFIEFERSQGL